MNNQQLVTKWRFLIVEDEESIVRQLEEIAPSCVEPPDGVEVFVCSRFAEGMARLRTERFDLLILDLKDDSDTTIDADSSPAGLALFEELKKTRFVPVVFYTALAHKVRSEQTSFVRVVEKTDDVTKVREAVKLLLSTQLPWLSRYIEDVQRKYIWDFVSTEWRESTDSYEQADIAYLLARRLALSLQNEARKMARKVAGRSVPITDPKNIHPMEMYIHPPVNATRMAGDILKDTFNGKYWMVLTPSCDFEHESKLTRVLLAQCIPLSSEQEYLKWKEDANAIDPLKAVIGDNRSKGQPERFKFLPGTYFLPDLIVDFQKLLTVSLDQLHQLKVIASLDSPFAEAVLARFSRYFGRLGTPDIDKTVVIARLDAAIQRSTPSEDSLGKTDPRIP